MRIGDIVGPGFVYQTESTVLRVAVRTVRADDAFLTARRKAREWLQAICARYDVELGADADATVRAGNCSVDLVSQPQRFAAALRHPDEHFEERVWHADLDLRACDGGDSAICDVRLRAEHPSSSRPIDPHPPRLIGWLCADPGICDAEPMGASATPVRQRDIGGLAALIDSTQRRLPVILVSHPAAVDANRLAGELAGLAHIFELDDEASWEINHRFGKAYSTYLGAVRIYPGGIPITPENPRAAPLFMPETLRKLAGDRSAEGALRRRVLADLTAQFEAEALATPAILRAQARPPAGGVAGPAATSSESARDDAPAIAVIEADVQRLRQEAAAARQDAEGYFQEWAEATARCEQLEGEIAQLRLTELGISVEELSPPHRDLLRSAFSVVTQMRDVLLDNDRLRTEYDDLRAEYESLRARLARVYTRDAPAAPENRETVARPAWDDFSELQAWASRRYRGQLAFHPRVRERLTDGHPQDIEALFDILDILGTDYTAMKRGEPGARERYVERIKGYKAGQALTRTGAGRVRELYDCVLDGKQLRAEDHQHIRERGTGFSGRTVCVYFVYDDATDRVVVTSMPRHLDTANSFT